MKKAVLNYLVIATLVIVAVCTSCGGGSGSSGNGKGLSGTYVGSVQGSEVSITFSGNKIKILDNKGEVKEGTYVLVEEYKENDFSRGVLTINTREGENKSNYVLEGNKLTFEGINLTKK